MSTASAGMSILCLSTGFVKLKKHAMQYRVTGFENFTIYMYVHNGLKSTDWYSLSFDMLKLQVHCYMIRASTGLKAF